LPQGLGGRAWPPSLALIGFSKLDLRLGRACIQRDPVREEGVVDSFAGARAEILWERAPHVVEDGLPVPKATALNRFEQRELVIHRPPIRPGEEAKAGARIHEVIWMVAFVLYTREVAVHAEAEVSTDMALHPHIQGIKGPLAEVATLFRRSVLRVTGILPPLAPLPLPILVVAVV